MKKGSQVLLLAVDGQRVRIWRGEVVAWPRRARSRQAAFTAEVDFRPAPDAPRERAEVARACRVLAAALRHGPRAGRRG